MTMITPSYLGETIEYSSLHACRSTLEDPTNIFVTDSLAYVTGDERYDLQRAGLTSELPQGVAATKAMLTDPQQRALLETADGQIRNYLALREQLTLQNQSPRDVLAATAPVIQAALDTLQETSRLGFDAVSTAEARQARRELLENTLGIAIAALGLTEQRFRPKRSPPGRRARSRVRRGDVELRPFASLTLTSPCPRRPDWVPWR